MESDLPIIDCVEKMREFLFALNPAFEKRRSFLLATRPALKPHEWVLEVYLAASLKVDIEGAAGRRKIHRLRRRLEMERRKSESPEVVREMPEVDYDQLPAATIEKLQKGILQLETLLSDGRLERWLKAGAQIAVQELWRNLIGLGGIKAYRFLAHLGVPAGVPDAPKRAFLFRLGWLKNRGAKPESFREFQSLYEKAARLTGESLRSLDYLIALFSGAERVPERVLPVCGKNPRCKECVLTNYCLYRRYADTEDVDGVTRVPMHAWLPEDQPRERLEHLGPSALSDAQLLAILLRTGTGEISALDLANKLLHTFGSLRGIEDASLKELCRLRGIGKVKAIEIKAAVELGKRFLQETREPRFIIKESADIFRRFQMHFTGIKQETFFMLLVNTRNHVIKECEVSRGSLTSSTVHPREVFKEAIRESASGVIFIHNHPSGDPAPSRADIALTHRLKEAGNILGIRVLDHVIIGENRYFSFADQGLL